MYSCIQFAPFGSTPITLILGFKSFAKFDKMDFVFQKATELGIAKLTPFTSEHSSFKLSAGDKQDKKLSHWQGILESACEQCGLNIWIP